LENGHQRPLPRIARLRKQRGRAYQPCHMHVMTAWGITGTVFPVLSLAVTLLA
jgi:hypothetical protein